MELDKKNELAELAMLTTFLDDQEIDQLARKKSFQKHVLLQKKLIASLLKKGFALSEDIETSEHHMTWDLGESSDVSESPKEPSAIKSAVGAVNPQLAISIGAVTETSKNQEDVLTKVTAIFAEKTGYPADMLEADLDLEGDLGVDTIKQMEVLAQVREIFGLEKEEGFSLKKTPTIKAVADYINSRL